MERLEAALGGGAAPADEDAAPGEEPEAAEEAVPGEEAPEEVTEAPAEPAAAEPVAEPEPAAEPVRGAGHSLRNAAPHGPDPLARGCRTCPSSLQLCRAG